MLRGYTPSITYLPSSPVSAQIFDAHVIQQAFRALCFVLHDGPGSSLSLHLLSKDLKVYTLWKVGSPVPGNRAIATPKIILTNCHPIFLTRVSPYAQLTNTSGYHLQMRSYTVSNNLVLLSVTMFYSISLDLEDLYLEEKLGPELMVPHTSSYSPTSVYLDPSELYPKSNSPSTLRSSPSYAM